jgi:uncharacterized lipoprotein YajG
MKHPGPSVAVLAATLMLAACDKPMPTVGASKSQADSAASSAMNAARAAAIDTGEALKDTAVAAQHEAEAAVEKTRESASSGDLQASMQRAGSDAKNAVNVAIDNTKTLANDAKDKTADQGSAKP